MKLLLLFVVALVFQSSSAQDVDDGSIEVYDVEGRPIRSGSEPEDILFADEDEDGNPSPEPEVPEVPDDVKLPEPGTTPAVDMTTFDELPDEPTESPFKFDAKCSCFMRTAGMKSDVDSSPLLGPLLTEAPKPEHCDNKGMLDCIEFCKEKVHEVTHDFDLTLVPKTDEETVTVTLGQYLCNIIRRHPYPRYMQSFARLECRSFNSHKIINASTGKYSKQSLVCIRGKFYQMRRPRGPGQH